MCPICGVDDPYSDGTGYHGSHICSGCAADGWIETHDGSYVNERAEAEARETARRALDAMNEIRRA